MGIRHYLCDGRYVEYMSDREHWCPDVEVESRLVDRIVIELLCIRVLLEGLFGRSGGHKGIPIHGFCCGVDLINPIECLLFVSRVLGDFGLVVSILLVTCHDGELV
jgi:hypothetical protein